MHISAVAAAFKCLSALAALWIPSAQVRAAPADHGPLRAFVSALFESTVSMVATAIADATHPAVTEECHHLASCASGALLATTQIAVNSAAADAAHIAALRSSSATRALADMCVAAAAPQGAAWSQVPRGVLHDLWVTLAEVFLVWPGRVRDAGDTVWDSASQSMQHVCAPVATAWSDLRARALDNRFDWAGAMPAVRRLCTFAATLLAAVGPHARESRRAMAAAVRPMVEAAVEVMAAAQHACAHAAALELSRLLVAAVQNSLKEMPEPLVERLMAVSAASATGAQPSTPTTPAIAGSTCSLQLTPSCKWPCQSRYTPRCR